MDWITTDNGLIDLITGLVGLITTGISTYFAIKAWIKATKDKSAQDLWNMIQEIAKTAIDEVEHSGITGSKNKKEAAMEIIKKSCKAAGLEIDAFLEQLSEYIDDCVKFYNDMRKKNAKKEKIVKETN